MISNVNLSYAIKVIEFYDEDEKEAIINEINLMKKLEHNHIVKYFGNFQYGKNFKCMVIEFCDVNILKDLL